MPTIKEYRVVLPLTLEEFQVGREWHKLEKLKMDLKMKTDQMQNPLEELVILSEPMCEFPFTGGTFESDEMGEHIVKQYGKREGPLGKNRLSEAYHSVGAFFELFFTDTVYLTDMECWEGYPAFRSITRNQFLGNHYEMIIEGYVAEGSCTLQNALNLPEPLKQETEVVLVDIAGPVVFEDYRDGKDPMIFRSTKTGRGPLKPQAWMETQDPVMTCYILVSIRFLSGPLGRYAERKLHSGIERALISYHRELFCLIDKWIDFTLEDIAYAKKQLEATKTDKPADTPATVIKSPPPPKAESTEDFCISDNETTESPPSSSFPSAASGSSRCPGQMVKNCWTRMRNLELEGSSSVLVGITALAFGICTAFVVAHYHLV